MGSFCVWRQATRAKIATKQYVEVGSFCWGITSMYGVPVILHHTTTPHDPKLALANSCASCARPAVSAVPAVPVAIDTCVRLSNQLCQLCQSRLVRCVDMSNQLCQLCQLRRLHRSPAAPAVPGQLCQLCQLCQLPPPIASPQNVRIYAHRLVCYALDCS